MTLDKRTPSEQIARFVEQYPGEWAQWSREGARYPVAYAVLRLHNLPNVCVTIGHEGAVVHTRTGGEAGELLPVLVKAPPGSDLLTKIVYRVADSLQIHLGSIEQLPPWLVDPVRVELRRRANDLLTLSGAPTTSPEISPDSQAIDQARNRLKATTALNGEQALGVLEDLRRILGVTLSPLEMYMRGPAPRCFNEDRDAMICARDEAQADGDIERAAQLQEHLDGYWRDPAPTMPIRWSR